jgi:hypothetical protein
MKSTIYINIAFEDLLSEAVIEKILNQSDDYYKILKRINGEGFGRLKKGINGFNSSSYYTPFFVLTDLNHQYKCPPELLNNWLDSPKNPNLFFSVAVIEVEAWILADRHNFSTYIGQSHDLIPDKVDEIYDPKNLLISLVRKSHNKYLIDSIVPQKKCAKQGPNYNEPLIDFIENHWDIDAAKNNSPSLKRTIQKLEEFKPVPLEKFELE